MASTVFNCAHGHRSPVVNQGGFTLIELVTVMVLISILAFSVLPRLDVLDGFNAPAYRDKVRATLQFARKAAVAQRRHVSVITADNGLLLSIASTDPDTGFPAQFARALRIPGTDGNAIKAPARGSLVTTQATLIFDAQGRPCNDQGIALANSVGFTVSGLALTVEAESGYVH